MPTTDIDRRTEYYYNADGRLVELTAINATTGDQVTRWEYGAALAESGVASNDLVRAKVYPDDVGGSDRVEYEYDRLGELSAMTDQNGTRHDFACASGARSGSFALSHLLGRVHTIAMKVLEAPCGESSSRISYRPGTS